MYAIHEHSSFTSAIDKYWYFRKKNNAKELYESMKSEYAAVCDSDESVGENSLNDTYFSTGDGNYVEMVYCKVEDDNEENNKNVEDDKNECESSTKNKPDNKSSKPKLINKDESLTTNNTSHVKTKKKKTK